MQENRSNDRARKRAMVRFGIEEPNKTGFTQNFSGTGLMVKTNNVFAPGTMLQVIIKFPDRVFEMWARVAWAKKVPAQLAHVLDCGMGLEFVEPPAEWKAYFKKSLA